MFKKLIREEVKVLEKSRKVNARYVTWKNHIKCYKTLYEWWKDYFPIPN